MSAAPPRPPRRPTSTDPDELGFEMAGMVHWLDPAELASAALRVVLSSTFGAYADKREVQAALSDARVFQHWDNDELWFDYAADLGDGFDPTYTVACALGAPELDLAAPDGSGTVRTERGRLLVLGGDQVYPTASSAEYERRFIGPYSAALPWVEGVAPELYAVPGNHDWYDGLTAFLRLFCRPNRIGGWETKQDRSYFAISLPHGWWLWAIDIQLGSYIDDPQLRYFNEQVAPRVLAGDSIILCVAEPSWVDVAEGGSNAEHDNLRYFLRKVVEPTGAQVKVMLAGDTHHYAHYRQTDGPAHLFTAGGGGAYLAGTHDLPDRLVLPPADPKAPDARPTEHTLATSYPTRQRSRRLAGGVVRLPFRNTRFWALLGAVHLLYGWMLQAGAADGRGFVETLRSLTVVDLPRLFVNPLAIIVTLVLWVGLAGFTKAERPLKRWGLGTTHLAAHLAVMGATILVSLRVLADLDDVAFVAAFIPIVGVAGGLLGCWVMAGYLLVVGSFGSNVNELFAAQRIADHKNLLRMHVGADGALTIYPIGIERVGRGWRADPDGAPGDPWLVAQEPASAPTLIEQPVRIHSDPRVAVRTVEPAVPSVVDR